LKLNSSEIEKLLEFLNFLQACSNDYEKTTNIFHLAEKNGFHITPEHFYDTIPNVKELSDKVFEVKENIHIDWNEENQLNLLEKLHEYSSEFQKLIQNKKFDANNGSFEWHDASVYYSIIRHFKPHQIVEVGIGNSTILASLASQKNNDTSITAIDPFVSNSFLKKIPDSVDIIKKPIQDFPVSFFKKLSKNDILFIDDSHVCKIGSDVNYLFLEILPELNPGVLVHIHDIFLPGQYPRDWILNDHRRFWNEQYILQAFLIENSEFEVLLANAFLSHKHPQKLTEFFKIDNLGGGGSFWMRKKNN